MLEDSSSTFPESASADSVADSHITEPKGGGTDLTEVCKFFKAGRYCKFGKRCRYLHQRTEKVAQEEIAVRKPTKFEDETVKSEDLQEVSSVSDEVPSSKQEKSNICQFYQSHGRCRYGRNCRYKHTKPRGNGRNLDGKRDERNWMREAPNDGEQPKEEQIYQEAISRSTIEPLEDNLAGLDVKDGRSKPRKRAVCRYFRKGYCAAGRRCHFLHSRRNTDDANEEDEVPPQPQPGMIDLPPKTDRRRPAVPRPPVQPVLPVSEYTLEELDDVRLGELRETELTQLKKRIPGDRLQELDDSEFKIIFKPTDPDWPYDVRELQFMVYIPIAYPASMMQVMTPEKQEMPGTVLSYVEYSMSDWIEKRFKEKMEKGKVELVFRPFLRWLDKTLEALFTEGLKQLKKEIAAQASGIECVPFWKLRVMRKIWKHEPESESGTGSDETSETESDSEDESGTDSDEDKENKRHQDMTDPEKKGTQIKMRCLQLLEGVGTLTCMKIKIVVHCSRCKMNCDLKLSANRAVGTTCTKCNNQMLVKFRPAMMHQMSSTLGYLDVEGCKATDVVLMDSVLDVGCISCSKITVLKGIQPGAVKNQWCHSCHQKFSLAVESTQFLELQPATVDTSNMQVIRKKKKMKDPTIQEGMPLPNFGTCKHYKKSFRWFRFPCCGMTYPCDVCHDDQADHEMQFANRMICGFCSKEQGFAGERPCISCDATLTKGTKTSHWEGGQGCRDKIKMSKNDQQKYANTNKTVSRKSVHKGKQRGKTTKLRHS